MHEATLCLALALQSGGIDQRGGDWNWNAIDAASRGGALAFHALGCSGEKPPDVECTVPDVDPRWRWTQLKFGHERSVRVTLLVAPREDGYALYADANRDRRLDPDEELMGDGNVRELSLMQLADDGGTETAMERRILLRFQPRTAQLSIAPADQIEGSVAIGERSIAARRIDADSNGVWTDPQDVLLLDLDADGAFDPLRERFAFAPILKLGDRRLELRSDAQGRWLHVQPVHGQGRLRLVARSLPSGTKVLRMTASLVARDGSAYQIEGVDRDLELPPGEYRVASVSFSLAPGAHAIDFLFANLHDEKRVSWHALADGESLEIDPIGTLSFEVHLEEDDCRPAQSLRVQPAMHTQEGLLIVTASLPGCTVSLRSQSGETLATSSSGFA